MSFLQSWWMASLLIGLHSSNIVSSSLKTLSRTHVYDPLLKMGGEGSANFIVLGSIWLLLPWFIWTSVNCHIRAVQALLSHCNRDQDRLYRLVGEVLFSTLQHHCKNYFNSIAISMANVWTSSILYFHQFRFLQLEHAMLLSRRWIIHITPHVPKGRRKCHSDQDLLLSETDFLVVLQGSDLNHFSSKVNHYLSFHFLPPHLTFVLHTSFIITNLTVILHLEWLSSLYWVNTFPSVWCVPSGRWRLGLSTMSCLFFLLINFIFLLNHSPSSIH